MSFDVSEVEAIAAKRHLDDCGPFCDHIEWCPTCADRYGVCARHAGGAKSIRFRRPTAKPPEPVCPRCGTALRRGPVGGGHFDWLECECTRPEPHRAGDPLNCRCLDCEKIR